MLYTHAYTNIYIISVYICAHLCVCDRVCLCLCCAHSLTQIYTSYLYIFVCVRVNRSGFVCVSLAALGVFMFPRFLFWVRKALSGRLISPYEIQRVRSRPHLHVLKVWRAFSRF